VIENAIIIPFRGLKIDKSRLKRDLPENKVESVLVLLTERLLKILNYVKYNKEVFILSKNSKIRLRGNYQILIDEGEDLNSSISKVISKIHAQNYIIIMADLPLIDTKNVEEVISLVRNKKAIVLVKSQDNGTSVIGFPKSFKFPFVFGRQSSKKFIQNFKNLKLPFVVIEEVQWSIDLDTKKDLREIIKNEKVPPFLKELTIDDQYE